MWGRKFHKGERRQRNVTDQILAERGNSKEGRPGNLVRRNSVNGFVLRSYGKTLGGRLSETLFFVVPKSVGIRKGDSRGITTNAGKKKRQKKKKKTSALLDRLVGKDFERVQKSSGRA